MEYSFQYVCFALRNDRSKTNFISHTTMKLTNKVAVITGGNSGIGLETARLFLAQGARVIITGRRAEALEEARHSLGAHERLHTIVSDAGSATDLARLQADVKALAPRIDILFVNAGIAKFAPVEYSEEALIDELLDINLKGAFLTAKNLLPLIPEGGSILFNASIVASMGIANGAIYSATKAGLLAITKTLALELAPKGIRVNALSPGPIATPIYGKLGMTQEQVSGFAESMNKRIPLNRFGRPEEMATVALFLSSDDASYVTGEEIRADGGVLLNQV